MEWRHEAVRWFDHWLKGEDTGIMDEPRFAVFVRDWHPPGPRLEDAPGRWRYEDGWPIARIRDQIAVSAATTIRSPRHPPAAATHRLRYVPSVGVEAGGPVMWWGDVAHDQRGTDAFSLVYDSAPLEQDVEILGFPRAMLTVAADAPRANWFARLSDVAPDGTVTQVAGAAMNGTHRDSAREPQDLVPGEPFELDIEMHFTSWVFPKGHRIRLAVNNAQWPMLWPTPEPMTTELKLGASRLTLPVVPFEQRRCRISCRLRRRPGVRRRRVDRGRHDLGLRRDLFGGPQSADRHGGREGDQRFRHALPLGRGAQSAKPSATRSTTAIRPTRRMNGTHRMEVDLPGRKLVWEAELDVSQRPRKFLLQLLSAADRERQAGPRKDLERNHT